MNTKIPFFFHILCFLPDPLGVLKPIPLYIFYFFFFEKKKEKKKKKKVTSARILFYFLFFFFPICIHPKQHE